jgi:hypothetical protein
MDPFVVLRSLLQLTSSCQTVRRGPSRRSAITDTRNDEGRLGFPRAAFHTHRERKSA